MDPARMERFVLQAYDVIDLIDIGLTVHGLAEADITAPLSSAEKLAVVDALIARRRLLIEIERGTLFHE